MVYANMESSTATETIFVIIISYLDDINILHGYNTKTQLISAYWNWKLSETGRASTIQRTVAMPSMNVSYWFITSNVHEIIIIMDEIRFENQLSQQV